MTSAPPATAAPADAPAAKPTTKTVPTKAAARPTTKATAKPAAKRGPGRPPSKPPVPPLERKGIVDSPKNSSNRLEFVYSEPLIFKALFTYFRNIKARDIHIRCSKHGLTFFARDHSKTSRNVAHIAGEHVNWHYCEGEFWLGINREKVERMFASIDKTFYKITIYQSHEDTSRLAFVFKDSELDKECNYSHALSIFGRDDDLYEAEALLTPESLATTFPIEFQLTAKQFKKAVGDASSYSDTITFEKLGEQHPLQLTYLKDVLTYNEVYRSPEKIKLRSNVAEGTTFRCTIKVTNVKSLAASMVTDDVRILCRESGDILFRSAIDAKALVVSTVTKLA